MTVRAFRSVVVALLLASHPGCGKSHAFVFYPVANGVLKWNVDSPALSPSSVNPQTKAIRYYIAADAYSVANQAREINAVRACFDQWQSIPGTTVRFEFAGLISPENLDTKYDGTNVVFWAKKSLRVNNGAEDLTGRRAWTAVQFANDGSILDADIVLNGVEYQWFTDFNNNVNQAQFIESIVLHEIGHFLGLDHSPAGGATVRDAANGINTNAGLSADEIAAARYLYPAGTLGSIQGTVRMNGAGIRGATVIAEDSDGNIAGAAVTQDSGKYAIYSLTGGTYRLRVCPLDPPNSGQNSLMRGEEVAFEYSEAVTSFLPTADTVLTMGATEARTLDFNVAAASGGPPVRVTSISRPSPLSIITASRYAVSATQGQSNLFLAVSSANFQPGAVLSVTGPGVTVGPTTFIENGLTAGIHSLRVPISISSNAVPGLRSLVVNQNGALAYANGYLDLAAAVPDYNFDNLDDRFQRTYWPLWTANEAAPASDPDGDGFSNRYEYRTGTNPIDGSSNRLELGPILKDRFGTRIIWPADPGATYRLFSAPTILGNWESAGTVSGGTEVLSAPISFSDQARYYRLELVR